MASKSPKKPGWKERLDEHGGIDGYLEHYRSRAGIPHRRLPSFLPVGDVQERLNKVRVGVGLPKVSLDPPSDEIRVVGSSNSEHARMFVLPPRDNLPPQDEAQTVRVGPSRDDPRRYVLFARDDDGQVVLIGLHTHSDIEAQTELLGPGQRHDVAASTPSSLPEEVSIQPSLIGQVQQGATRRFASWVWRRMTLWNAAKATAAGTAAAVGAGALITGYGYREAEDRVEGARKKLGVAIEVLDPDLAEDPVVGYAYGPRVGAPEEVYGIDRSILVYPEELLPGGSLYYWYQGMITIEDNQHDGGFSDWTGLNYRMPYTILMGQGGGSSLADQTCGQLEAGMNGSASHSRVRRKLEDIVCGMGLAQLKEPHEIGALYATYGYLGPRAEGVKLFVQLYYGFSGVDDPRMTIGHQLVMASMVRYTWDSTDSRWESIKARARLSVDRLIKQRIISELDQEAIYRQIERAKPMTKAQAKKKSPGLSVAPTPGYDYPIYLAIREMEDRRGSDWRDSVSSVTLTIDPNVQYEAVHSTQEALEKMNDSEHLGGVALVVDSQGRIIAAYSGDEDGFDMVNRIDNSPRSPASMGKLLLASAAAEKGLEPSYDKDNRRVRSFRTHLRKSQSAIVSDAKRLKLRPRHVRQLIECFGIPNPGTAGDWLTDAAMGNWSTTPRQFIPILDAECYGLVMPEPYVVHSYTLRTGKQFKLEPQLEVSEEREVCAHAMTQGGLTYDWATVPLEEGGTLHRLEGIADRGKTGTVGLPDGGTNMAWVIAAKEYPQTNYTVLVGVGADYPNVDVGGSWSGATAAAPVVSDLLLEVRGRQGKLITDIEWGGR